MKKENKNIILISLLGLYFLINLFFLDKFPFMHSDESWLSGLTRTMMNEGVSSTETFFDLLPRYPHAIKTIFHILQMPFIMVFGYNLFAVRLLSLIFGCALLYVFYKLVYVISGNKIFLAVSAAALAFNVQFLYASHFARQEIIIAFGMLFALYYLYKNIGSWSIKNDIVTGLIIGIMIGIHPNSFIAALAVGSVYIYYIAIDKKAKIKNLAVLVGIVALFAGLFIGISYIFDSQFITHYLKYGDHLGVTMTFSQKIKAIVPYYQKLWLWISGTYYTPWIKAQLAVFAIAIIGGAIYAFWNKKVLAYIFPVIAVNIGYIIIGRYSQPSYFLMFVTSFILTIFLINQIKRFKIFVIAVVAVLTVISSAMQVMPYINNDYKEYLNDIENAVPEDAKVLANLNAEYALSYDALYDYRNLGYLDDNNMSFADYVNKNGIEYIIYPEEMDYIYETRPVWNIVYGNIYPYYEDMKEFLDLKCELQTEFYSPYAMRIVKFADNKNWSVKVYKVVR